MLTDNLRIERSLQADAENSLRGAGRARRAAAQGEPRQVFAAIRNPTAPGCLLEETRAQRRVAT
jgi:hypothetical protein